MHDNNNMMMKLFKKLVSLKVSPPIPYSVTILEPNPEPQSDTLGALCDSADDLWERLTSQGRSSEHHSPTSISPETATPADLADIEPDDVTYFIPTPAHVDYQGTVYVNKRAFTDGHNSSISLYESEDGNQKVVIKRPIFSVSKSELTRDPNPLADATLYCSSTKDREQVQQFKTESIIAKALRDAPDYFIVIQDVLHTPITISHEQLEAPLGILPYANGGSLHDYLQDPHLIEEKIALWERMVTVMTELHTRNVYSTDLHPKNWLFDDGVLKLADFGLAYTPDTDGVGRPKQGIIKSFNPQAITNMIQQSFDEVTDEAPLVADFEANMAANDRWMMGINLFQMICGKHPFTIQSVTIDGLRDLLQQQEDLLGVDLREATIQSSPKLRQALIDAQVPDDQLDHIMKILARCFTNDPEMTIAGLSK